LKHFTPQKGTLSRQSADRMLLLTEIMLQVMLLTLMSLMRICPISALVHI
jgi:hypothetical protein